MTSSPHYPKSNGSAEAAVKSVKSLIKKCNRSKQDLLEGLLILRNTPSASGVSPAQLLKGVKLRDNLPSINYGVDQRRSTRNIEQERDVAKKYYDPTATKTNDSFKEGVVIQDIKTKE